MITICFDNIFNCNKCVGNNHARIPANELAVDQPPVDESPAIDNSAGEVEAIMAEDPTTGEDKDRTESSAQKRKFALGIVTMIFFHCCHRLSIDVQM